MAGGPTDLTGAAARISGMDLPAWFRRTLGTRCVRVVTSAPGSGARRPDRPRTSRPSSARTGRRRGAPPSSSSTTRLPRRTSPRRPFSPRSATSTASTAAGRSGRGCTGSSSTVRSTGRAHARCAPSSSWSTPPRRPRRPTSARTSSRRSRRLSPEHRAVIVLRHLLGYTPGEIARLLDLPRGTVNSRLRRGLDQLQETLP